MEHSDFHRELQKLLLDVQSRHASELAAIYKKREEELKKENEVKAELLSKYDRAHFALKILSGMRLSPEASVIINSALELENSNQKKSNLY